MLRTLGLFFTQEIDEFKIKRIRMDITRSIYINSTANVDRHYKC